MPGVAVIIQAYNEAERIGETVAAALTLPGVDQVVVASDGSTDATVRVARDAGAAVWRASRNQGKAAAMLAGAEAVRELDRRHPADGPRHLLFLDADVGVTADGKSLVTTRFERRGQTQTNDVVMIKGLH